MIGRRVKYNSLYFILGIVSMIFISLSLAQECPPPPCTWNYFMPSTWPTVCGGIYSICGDGTRQSPISINTAEVVGDASLTAKPLEIHYQEVYHTSVQNLGTSIQVDIDGNNTVWGGPLPNTELILSELRFHVPGEHRINDAESAGEIHMFHYTKDIRSIRQGAKNAPKKRDSSGALFEGQIIETPNTEETVIIVVRIQPGNQNEGLDEVLKARDLPFGSNSTIDINPLKLFPDEVLDLETHMKHLNYYYYIGSLTHPPCTEGIHWIVLIDPIYASQDQLDELARWEGINNRPVQTQFNGTVYHPKVVAPTPAEDIRYMGMVIGLSFLLALIAFFGIIGIAIGGMMLKEYYVQKDFYGTQQFELSLRKSNGEVPEESPTMVST